MNTFEQYRPLLFGIAYRMLGSAMEAEDMVQETYLRYEAVPPERIAAPKAFLCTVITRLCLDHLKSARAQRETYVGPWLPEPLLTEHADYATPATQMHEWESLSTAFLVLLENLSPLDRAVYLLHEVFNYTFAEIARIVDKTPADCRQIGHRARQRLMQGRPRFEVETETVDEVVQQFLRACVGDDMSTLLALLAPDVTVTSDSGGKVSAVRNKLVGTDKVARLFLGIFRKWSSHQTFHIATVNGQPAMIGITAQKPSSVVTFEVRDGRIHAIYLVLNPDKLTGLVFDPEA